MTRPKVVNPNPLVWVAFWFTTALLIAGFLWLGWLSAQGGQHVGEVIEGPLVVLILWFYLYYKRWGSLLGKR